MKETSIPPKALKVLPVLVCRKEQIEDLGKSVEDFKRDFITKVKVLKQISVNDEKDLPLFETYRKNADVILLYKPHLGLGDCVIKIAESDLPIILFHEELQVMGSLDALEYIHPRKNVWVAVDYQSIDFRVKLLGAKKGIENTKILVLNSDYPHWKRWLCRISGGLESIEGKFGIGVEYVNSGDVVKRWENVEERRAEKVAEEWMEDAEKIIEPRENDVRAVARLYLAMKDLLQERGAEAITMAYGDDPLPVPCFAYANLRDEGKPAACEADIISLVSMVISHYLTDKPSFMGNTFIDLNDNALILSHCVAPRKMQGYDKSPAPYVLRSQHWGQFVGSLSAFVRMDAGQEVTVCRLTGDLDSMLVTRGEIIDCRDLEGFCRVTVKIRVDAPIRKFIGKTSGNHHVMVYGDYREELRELNTLFGIATVEVS